MFAVREIANREVHLFQFLNVLRPSVDALKHVIVQWERTEGASGKFLHINDKGDQVILGEDGLLYVEIALGENGKIVPVVVDLLDRIICLAAPDKETALCAIKLVQSAMFNRLKIMTPSTRKPAIVLQNWVEQGVPSEQFRLGNSVQIWSDRLDTYLTRGLKIDLSGLGSEEAGNGVVRFDLVWRERWSLTLRDDVVIENLHSTFSEPERTDSFFENYKSDFRKLILELRKLLQ